MCRPQRRQTETVSVSWAGTIVIPTITTLGTVTALLLGMGRTFRQSMRVLVPRLELPGMWENLWMSGPTTEIQIRGRLNSRFNGIPKTLIHLRNTAQSEKGRFYKRIKLMLRRDMRATVRDVRMRLCLAPFMSVSPAIAQCFDESCGAYRTSGGTVAYTR